MRSDLPNDMQQLLDDIDHFIDTEIAPLQAENDNERFFDHRREWARTDFEAGGLPRPEWHELLSEMRRRADKAGFLRRDLPTEVGGTDASNFEMAVVREHLAHRGLGLHNDLQDESSIIGNFPSFHLVWKFGTGDQRSEFAEADHRRAFPRVRPHRTRPRIGRDVDGDDCRPLRWRLDHQRRQAVEHRDAHRHS